MSEIGKVTAYDGRFGTIIDAHGKVDFKKKDIAFGEVHIGDYVEYRKETRDPDLIIARHIKILNNITRQ